MQFNALVLNVLLLLICLKLCGFLLSAWTVLRLRAVRKLTEFWKEYWNWKYVQDNTINLSVWFVTLTSYLYCYHMLHGVHSPTIPKAFNTHPFLVSYVIGSTVWLLISTTLQTIASVKHTVKLCDQLTKHEIIKKLGKAALLVGLYYFEYTGWPFLIGMTLGKEIPKFFINRKIEKRMAIAVEEFILLSTLEYLFRASVVIASFYITTETLKLW